MDFSLFALALRAQFFQLFLGWTARHLWLLGIFGELKQWEIADLLRKQIPPLFRREVKNAVLQNAGNKILPILFTLIRGEWPMERIAHQLKLSRELLIDLLEQRLESFERWKDLLFLGAPSLAVKIPGSTLGISDIFHIHVLAKGLNWSCELIAAYVFPHLSVETITQHLALELAFTDTSMIPADSPYQTRPNPVLRKVLIDYCRDHPGEAPAYAIAKVAGTSVFNVELLATIAGWPPDLWRRMLLRIRYTVPGTEIPLAVACYVQLIRRFYSLPVAAIARRKELCWYSAEQLTIAASVQLPFVDGPFRHYFEGQRRRTHPFTYAVLTEFVLMFDPAVSRAAIEELFGLSRSGFGNFLGSVVVNIETWDRAQTEGEAVSFLKRAHVGRLRKGVRSKHENVLLKFDRDLQAIEQADKKPDPKPCLGPCQKMLFASNKLFYVKRRTITGRGRTKRTTELSSQCIKCTLERMAKQRKRAKRLAPATVTAA